MRCHFSSVFGVAVAILLAGAGCQKKQTPSGAKIGSAQQESEAKTTPDALEKSATKRAEPEPFANWPKPTCALVLTGQQLGYLEPCGCTGLENQKGGLARRQTFIKQLTDKRGWPVVPLDVGNQVQRFGKQQELKFETTVKGLRAMGYRGLTLGTDDLRLTPGALFATLANAEGKLADVVDANVGLFDLTLQQPYLIVESGGKRLGVTAVLGAGYEEKLRGDEIAHQPPLEALQKAAAELKEKKCDFYVLVAHASLDDARKLAREVPLFDLVVASGDTNIPSRELEIIEGTKSRLMQVGHKAMNAGVVGIFDDPQTPIRYESVPLDARFADSSAMLKLLADYQEQLQELGLEGLGVKPQPHPSGRKFVGTAKCGECHTKAHDVWSKTTHARATDSLVKPPNSRGHIARHFDPECLSCHVTGWEPQKFFPYDSGYLSLEKTPQLQHNGCENCHGPGSAHVAAESGDGGASAADVGKLRESMRLPLAGGVAERKCMECHDDDNSPDFHKPGAFERYWKEVEHRGKD